MNYLQIPGDPRAVVWRDGAGNSGVIREGDDGWEDFVQWCDSGNTALGMDHDTDSNAQQEEQFWSDSELTKATQEIFKHEDSDPGATATIGAWRTYRKELRAWPAHASFPDIDERPVSPMEASHGTA